MNRAVQPIMSGFSFKLRTEPLTVLLLNELNRLISSLKTTLSELPSEERF